MTQGFYQAELKGFYISPEARIKIEQARDTLDTRDTLDNVLRLKQAAEALLNEDHESLKACLDQTPTTSLYRELLRFNTLPPLPALSTFTRSPWLHTVVLRPLAARHIPDDPCRAIVLE